MVELLLLFLFLLLLFLIGLKLYVYHRLSKMKGKDINLVDTGIIYFYSPGCGACKIMTPIIEKLKDNLKVIMVDVTSENGFQIAKELGIMATPTTLVIKDGKILKGFVGVVSAEKILRTFTQ